MSSEAVTYLPNALGSAPDRSTAVRADTERAPHQQAKAYQYSEQDNLFLSNNSEITDEKLLDEVSYGARESLAILFRRYARLVRMLAYRVLRDAAEADDLLQEVFLYIFRKAALFDPSKGTARSWIIQVTYHRAFNRRQQLKSRHFYDAKDADDLATGANLQIEVAFYERTLEGTLGKETIKRIEESLSGDQRRTIQLYFFEGYTIEETAKELGQSPGNVYHHYYRALEKMRKLVFAPKLLSK